MLVIAFDGILFDTLEFRAHAVIDALAAEGVVTSKQHVLSILPSHSLAEAVRAATGREVDETTLDLAALRAERAISEMGSRGAVLNVAVRDRLRRAAAVTRIAVRADSRRREVEELLRLAELDSVVAFVRCSDDVGNHTKETSSVRTSAQATDSAVDSGSGSVPFSRPSARQSTIEHSYAHITRRLYSHMTLLGTAAHIGIALEVGEAGRTVARTHGFATPENFDTAHLPLR